MGKRAHTYSSEGTSQVFLQGLFWFQTSDNTLVFWTGRQTERPETGAVGKGGRVHYRSREEMGWRLGARYSSS